MSTKYKVGDIVTRDGLYDKYYYKILNIDKNGRITVINLKTNYIIVNFYLGFFNTHLTTPEEKLEIL